MLVALVCVILSLVMIIAWRSWIVGALLQAIGAACTLVAFSLWSVEQHAYWQYLHGYYLTCGTGIWLQISLVALYFTPMKTPPDQMLEENSEDDTNYAKFYEPVERLNV